MRIGHSLAQQARAHVAALFDDAGRRVRKTARAIRPAPPDPGVNELRDKWEAWARRIQKEVGILQDHHATWLELNDAVAPNPMIPQPNYVLDWVRELFGIVVAVGIRAQADRSSDVVNLARLIDDIAGHPEALTRSWFVERYPVGLKNVGDKAFDKFAGPGGEVVDAAILHQDLALLRSTAKKVSAYVNKHIAHSAEVQDVEIPTYEDLRVVLEEFDGLLRRYYLLAEGGGLVSTTPTKQYNFLKPLIVPWVPNNRFLRLLRERGDLPYDPTENEQGARDALRKSEPIDPKILEGLLAEFEHLRSELGHVGEGPDQGMKGPPGD